MKIVSSQNSANRRDTIALEAASWVAQIDAKSLSASDRLALAEWMARSPAHAEQLRLMAGLWGGVDDVLDDLIKQQSAPKWKNIFAAWIALRPRQFAALCGVAIMAIVAPLVVLSSFHKQNLQIAVDEPVVYTALKGADLKQTLSDGSVIHLNTDTQIEVLYTPQRRKLRLIKGEAFFDVAHDASRPFEVYAGERRVQAIGTAFIVSLLDDHLDVVVTEGKVRVDTLPEPLTKPDARNQADDNPVFVPAGHRVEVEETGHKLAELRVPEIEKEIAWRHGQMKFTGDTLQYIVDEIHRYSDQTIVIADPNLRDRRLGGTFSTNDVEAVLMAMELSMGIKADYVGDDLIYLTLK